jgi:hypothetical protein
MKDAPHIGIPPPVTGAITVTIIVGRRFEHPPLHGSDVDGAGTRIHNNATIICHR